MSIDNNTKIDKAFKFVSGKGYTTTQKSVDNEDAPSGFIVGTSSIFSQDAGIPITAPGTSTSLLTFYGDGYSGARFRMIYDVSSPLNQAWYASTNGTNLTTMRSTRVSNWVPPTFGNYTIRMFLTSGTNTTAAYVKEIFFSDATSPLFDYKTGILTFQSDPLAAYSGLSPTPDGIQISGYVYIGPLLSQIFDAYGNFTAGLTDTATAPGTALAKFANSTGLTVTPISSSTNSKGLTSTGNGTGAGLSGIGGNTSGNGVSGTGGSPNGNGISGTGTGTGAGIVGTGGSSQGVGVVGLGGAGGIGIGVSGAGTGNGPGVSGTGAGTGAGVRATGGSNGEGIVATGTGSKPGGSFQGGPTGPGIITQAPNLTNDSPLVLYLDQGGNYHGGHDHLGYSRFGRVTYIEEQWVCQNYNITGTGSSIQLANQNRWGWYGTGANEIFGVNNGNPYNLPSIENQAGGANETSALFTLSPVLVYTANMSVAVEFEVLFFGPVTNADFFVGLSGTNPGFGLTKDNYAIVASIASMNAIGVGFRGSTDANYRGVTANGSAASYTPDSGVAVATQIKFRMELHGANTPYGAKARFFFGNAANPGIGTAIETTTDLPAANTPLYFVTAVTSFAAIGGVASAQVSPFVIAYNRFLNSAGV